MIEYSNLGCEWVELQKYVDCTEFMCVRFTIIHVTYGYLQFASCNNLFPSNYGRQVRVTLQIVTPLKSHCQHRHCLGWQCFSQVDNFHSDYNYVLSSSCKIIESDWRRNSWKKTSPCGKKSDTPRVIVYSNGKQYHTWQRVIFI